MKYEVSELYQIEYSRSSFLICFSWIELEAAIINYSFDFIILA